MTFRSWFEVKAEEDVRGAFEALLPNWSFVAAHRGSGELRWRLSLSSGFAIELTVHPADARGTGVAFQTKLYLVNSELLALELTASFAGCQPSSPVILNERGILVSIYVEGLVRLLRGGAITLPVWEPNDGLEYPERWRSLVDESIGVFGDLASDIRAVPQKLLDLDLLGGRMSPTPIALFGNPFLLAAEAAVLLGDSGAAAQYVQSGKEHSWSQPGGSNAGGLAAVAACKANRLAELGFERPG